MSLTTEKGNNTKIIAEVFHKKGDTRVHENVYSIIDNTDVDFSSPNKVIVKNQNGFSKYRNIDNKYIFPYIHDFNENMINERIYISGVGGCGKSFFFIRNYAIYYHAKFKKNPVILISSKSEDKCLDELGFIKRLIIDEDIIHNKIDISEFRNSLVIFDDIEDFKDKKITKAIRELLEECINNGRSYGMYLLYVNHSATDYSRTRNLIRQATACVIFPTAEHIDKNYYDYLLKNYVKINDANMTIIKNVKTEYVYIDMGSKIIISNKYILV